MRAPIGYCRPWVTLRMVTLRMVTMMDATIRPTPSTHAHDRSVHSPYRESPTPSGWAGYQSTSPMDTSARLLASDAVC